VAVPAESADHKSQIRSLNPAGFRWRCMQLCIVTQARPCACAVNINELVQSSANRHDPYRAESELLFYTF